jgi:RNA polymerase sigma-70 factor (ECF subfamily)
MRFYEKHSDNDLISIVLSEPINSQKAFEELVNRYKNYVFQVCYSKLKNAEDSEDAAQEVFVRTYFGLKNFRFESEFKTWLTQITLNVALTINLSNKRKFWKTFISTDGDVDIDSIYRTTLTKAQEDNFWTVVGSTLRKMIFIYRKVFILKYFKNLKTEIISEKIQISIGATKMKLKRAKDQFIYIFKGD